MCLAIPTQLIELLSIGKVDEARIEAERTLAMFGALAQRDAENGATLP